MAGGARLYTDEAYLFPASTSSELTDCRVKGFSSLSPPPPPPNFELNSQECVHWPKELILVKYLQENTSTSSKTAEVAATEKELSDDIKVR